jgi:hypothetical protein
MVNPQQPRDRIKRPEVFSQPEIEPEPLNDTSEGLSLEETVEWLARQQIRTDNRLYEIENKMRGQPIRQPQGTRQPIPARVPQPHEKHYGPTQDELERANPPPKKKGGINNKRLVGIIILVALAGVAIYYAVQMLMNGYTITF